FAPSDLHGLALAAAGALDGLAAEKQVTIECPEPVGEAVAGVDRARIMQVLRNLLSNALKFTPAGGAPVEVLVTRDGPVLGPAVRDHGLGIPPSDLETIFDKFVQSSRTKSGAGGTGLGLAISRELVLGHHGRIWAEHTAGGGATVVLEVPVLGPDEL